MSRTALGVARGRAAESSRPDRLFDDPYAAAFVAAAPSSLEPPPVQGNGFGALMAYHIAVRTRFFDDYLLHACERGCRQVVLLAAGLDARAYRLPWPPDVQLYELDLPAVLEFKERVLRARGASARCERRGLAVDLREDWPAVLRAAGFDPGAATAWLVEGLLMYLTPDEADVLLRTVSDLSAPDSQISFEYRDRVDAAALARARSVPGFGMYADLWRGGLAQHGRAWLDAHGWRALSRPRGEAGRAYGREPPVASDAEFITAVRLAPPQPHDPGAP